MKYSLKRAMEVKIIGGILYIPIFYGDPIFKSTGAYKLLKILFKVLRYRYKINEIYKNRNRS